jgi:hypothetical protein
MCTIPCWELRSESISSTLAEVRNAVDVSCVAPNQVAAATLLTHHRCHAHRQQYRCLPRDKLAMTIKHTFIGVAAVTSNASLGG